MKDRNEKSIRAAGYIRVSTDEQVSDGLSLSCQESRIRAYAESQNWIIVNIYREEGISGKTLERPQLKRMLADIKDNSFDIVLVYKVDRLTRRQKDLWYILEDIFEPHGVGFKSVIEPFDTTTAQGKAFLGMLGVFAQLERDTISERTKDSLKDKRTNGKWVGRPPFGFKINSGGELEKDPKQQSDIAKIKRMRRQGKSFREIAGRVGISYMAVSNISKDNLKQRNSRYINGIGA